MAKKTDNEKLIQSARNYGVTIGEDCMIAPSIHFGSEPFLIFIGDHVRISYNVDFITHDGGTWVFRERPEYKGIVNYNRIIIENNCMIGAGVTIMPGVVIEENCIVGARSVVTKSLKANGVYAGNPAKYICSLDEYIQKSVDKWKKYNKDYDKNADRATQIQQRIEGVDLFKPFI